MKKTLVLLWVGVALATSLKLSGTHFSSSIINIIQSVVNLVIVFILPGFCIAHIAHAKRKDSLDAWEYVNIASASSLILVPLLLLIENALIGKLYTWIPSINTLALFTVAYYIGHKKRIPSVTDVIQPIWILTLGIFALLSIVLSTSYVALPESDPYYWLQQYRNLEQNAIFSSQARPLFYALSFLFVNASHIDLYTYFKYVLPFLSILSIVPAALVARQYTSNAMRIVILCIPLFAPSTFLYSQIPFPQAISILLMYYFLFWFLYSRIKKNRFFYYGAGIVSLLSYFYHEIGLILFAIWLIVTAIHYRKHILKYSSQHKITVLLIMLLIVSNHTFFFEKLFFVWSWIKIIIQNIPTINWMFPAEYINIDGRSVGWGDITGVTKYYLYYVGPVLLCSIVYFAYLLAKRKDYRLLVIKNFITYPEIQIISVLGVLFFTASEILPRFGGIAMLPERLWTIGSIFFSLITLSIAGFYEKRNRVFIVAIICILTFISLGASLYVNSLKKYVIPVYQLKSTTWIKNNLPADRVIISSGNYGTLLRIHATSQTITIENSFYCDNAVQYPTILFSELPRNDVYVYYAKDDERNPYLSRPYIQKPVTCEKSSFSNYPEHYAEIYNDHNNVIIWKVK